jgi:polysaccharide biosynthesis transport protein
MPDRERFDLTPRGAAGVPAAPAFQSVPGARSASPAEGEGEGGGGLDLRKVPSILLRYKWLVLASVVLGAVAAVASMTLTPPRYTVSALIHTPNAQTGVTAIQAGQRQSSLNWQNLLPSYSVVEPVVRELGLYIQAIDPQDAPLFEGVELEGEIVSGRYRLQVDASGRTLRILDRDGGLVEEGPLAAGIGAALGIRLTPRPELLRPGLEARFRLTPPRDVARGIARSMNIQTNQFIEYISVNLSGNDPVHAARLLNAVLESFLREATELSRATSDQLSRTLEQQLVTARQTLQEAEGELEAFHRANVLSPAQQGAVDGSSPAMDAYIELQLQVEDLERDRAAILRALGTGGASGVRIQALEAIPAVQGSSELTGALEQIADARAERRGLLQRYTEDYPLVAELDARLRTLEGQVVPSLAREILEELEARLGEGTGRLRTRSAELGAIPTRSIREASLRREVGRAETLYEDVSQRYESARLASISADPDVRVVDWAEPPTNPESDRRILMATVVFFGFMGTGVVGALVLDRGDRRVRSPMDVEWQLGVQVLGAVPHLRTRKGRVEQADHEHAVEAFRSIRTGILFAHGSAGPLVFTVTSPDAGDGKSFTVSNLALCFAELGRRTVIVDGDVRRGVQHRLLDVERKPGLTDCLAGDATLEAALIPAEHPLLSVLPRGAGLQNGPELLSTPAMQDLLAQLKEEFDVILVDSPPLGAAADPVILGTLTGSLVLVVRSGSTDSERAEGMLRNLKRFPVRVLGAVVNDVASADQDNYYGYVPGYGVEAVEPLHSVTGEVRLRGAAGIGRR